MKNLQWGVFLLRWSTSVDPEDLRAAENVHNFKKQTQDHVFNLAFTWTVYLFVYKF